MTAMHTTGQSKSSRRRQRDWFARLLGIQQQRREEIYAELSRSASLLDGSYWLQVLFSAGIATLGLALNSPAVIIGAMLISPLMGPILASGLALAAGDLILGIRATAKLAASCLVAVSLASVLVAMLPFSEITTEVAARSHPNTLDLVVALFSGAIGAIAVCKEVKGVATSIPGVAIAVALMPPLCIVGYGTGIAASLNFVQGASVAHGGALLFLTNLVAITFMAMVVFITLRLKVEGLPDDVESFRIREFLKKYPKVDRLRGSLRARLVAVLIAIGILLVPLSQSFTQLKNEFILKQEEARVREATTQLWQEYFARFPDGAVRSFVGQPAVTVGDKVVSVQINVFTNKPYTAEERASYERLVATRLNRPVDSIDIQLIEVPTAAGTLASRPVASTPPARPPTVAQLQAQLLQSVDFGIKNVILPPGTDLLDHEVTARASGPLAIRIAYLGARDIDKDAQMIIGQSVARDIAAPDAIVTLERVDSALGEIPLTRNKTGLRTADKDVLDRAATILQRFPKLQMEVQTPTDELGRQVTEYMSSRWHITRDRMPVHVSGSTPQAATLELKAFSGKP